MTSVGLPAARRRRVSAGQCAGAAAATPGLISYSLSTHIPMQIIDSHKAPTANSKSLFFLKFIESGS
jgi:hypothetical protein